MIVVTGETCENNGVQVLVDGNGKLWLNVKHLKIELGHEHLPVITNKYDKYDSRYRKRRLKIVDEPEK